MRVICRKVSASGVGSRREMEEWISQGMVKLNGRVAQLGDKVAPGDHVLCAVTGARIPLGTLRYWSHELQEAYASPEIAVQRYVEMKAKGRL